MNLFYSKYIKYSFIAALILGFGINKNNSLKAQVSLTATSGALTGTYSNLSIAFDSINKGRHQGTIVITLTANTSEPANPVSLRETGASIGPVASNYNNILIKPSGNITVTANPNTNRAIIELFGADYVTIDGDDPATTGDKNLTFTLGTTGISTAAIHIGSNNTSGGQGADFNTIKNINIIGARTNNINTTATYGIVVSRNSITSIITAGHDNQNTTIDNVDITRALHGIWVAGTNGFEFDNLVIKNCKIGVTTNINNGIGQNGIFLSGVSSGNTPAVIEKNEIVVGLDVPTGTGYLLDCIGIFLSNNCSGTIIRYNNIHDIINYNTSTTNLCAGISISGTSNMSNIDINNNFIRDVIVRKKTTSVVSSSIRVNSTVASNLLINFNTLAQVRGNLIGTTSGYGTSVLFVSSITGNTSISEFNNNIIYDANNSTACYGVYLANGPINIATSLMTNNCYYIPNGNIGVFGNFIYPTLDDWQLVTLKDISSFVEKPKFISNTNLHIIPNVVTKLESNALGIASIVDIDNEVRPMAPATISDIGADEFTGIAKIPSQIISVSHTPTAITCSSVPRDITANVIKGNSDTAVYLSYSFENGAFTNIKMTNTSGNIYTATIPATFPSFNKVAYRVFLIDSLKGDTVSSNYNYYNDFRTVGAYMPPFLSDVTQACIGSNINLSYSIPANSTLFNPAPVVYEPLLLADIESVSVGTLSNTSTLNTLNGTIGVPSGIAGQYSNYKSIRTDTFEIAKSYPMQVSTESNGLAKNYIAAFIDINGDGDFIDADERIANTIYIDAVGARTEKFNLFIPRTSKPGKTVLRIITSNTPIVNATSYINYGETEDYSIYIRPMSYNWVINGVDGNTTNPYTLTITTLPTTIALKIKDTVVNPACETTSNPINITASTGAISVSLIGSSTGCINDMRSIKATISGGCAPYSYSWSSGETTSSANVFLTIDSINTYSVTVTDKDGLTATDTITINAKNPKPLTFDPKSPICVLGIDTLIATDITKNSLYWYNLPTDNPYSPIFIGDTFITPLLSSSRTFYVSAVRSSKDSSGRANIGTNTTQFASVLGVDNGLSFTTTQPITISRCAIYGAGTGVTVNIGIKDRSGTLIAQTGIISVTMAANATTPTLIPLSLSIPIPDSGYQMVLLSYTGLTTLNRNSAGHTYPINATKSLIITGGINLGNFNHPNYYYFYNILYSSNLCVGNKNAITKIVKDPSVPKVYQDLSYTKVCKGANFVFPIVSDSFGNIYTWYKNGKLNKIDTVPNSIGIFNPPVSTLMYNRMIYNTTNADTGEYYAVISSSRKCTRDTFTRKVHVDFYPTAKITSDLQHLNACVNTKGELSVGTDIGNSFKWYKDNVFYKISNSPKLTFDTLKKSDEGIYHVITNDIHNCREDTSSQVTLLVFNHPSVTPKALDSAVICEDGRYTIKHQISNYTNLQWYKDGALVPYFLKDSFLIRNALVSDSGMYHLEVNSYPGCITAYTIPTHLTVNPKAVLNLNPFQFDYCEGDRLLVPAKYKNAKEIEWYKDGFYTGLNSDTFKVPVCNVLDAGKYKFNIIGYDKCPNMFSNDINVDVHLKPHITSTNSNKLFCEESEIKMAYTTSNVTKYQWMRNDVDIQAVTDSILYFKFLSIQDTGLYRLRVTSLSSCKDTISSSFRISVIEKPRIIVQPKGTVACAGNSYTFTTSSVKGLTYQWKRNGINIVGAKDSTYKIISLNTASKGKYTLEVTGKAPCPAVTSDTAVIDVKSGATNAYLSQISIYDAEEQCTDDNGWTYYAENRDKEKYLFAVRKNGNTFTSKADIIVRPNVFQNISNTKDSFTGTYMLKRCWNLDLISGSITNPIDVKFYIDLNEQLELESKVLALKTLHETTLDFKTSDLIWFKTPDTLPFSNKLLTLIQGSSLNFPYSNIPVVISGKDGAIDFYQLENIEAAGGGSAMKQFKGSTKFLNSVLNAENEIDVNLYPNPNQGKFQLEINTSNLKGFNASVVNSLGQVVFQQFIPHKTYSTITGFDVEHLPAGSYFIQLNNEQILKSIKLEIVK